ncbi:hypothetical protein ACJX0J_035361, partial [Zea mays]
NGKTDMSGAVANNNGGLQRHIGHWQLEVWGTRIGKDGLKYSTLETKYRILFSMHLPHLGDGEKVFPTVIAVQLRVILESNHGYK